jgi:uncharacterized protein YlxP (DUF503 family)
MLVGVCKIDLLIAEGHSLKEKRSVIKSMIQRLQNKFSISAAEVGYLDMLRRSEIGFAIVSNEAVHLEKMISEAVSFIELDSRVQSVGIEKEIIPF